MAGELAGLAPLPEEDGCGHRYVERFGAALEGDGDAGALELGTDAARFVAQNEGGAAGPCELVQGQFAVRVGSYYLDVLFAQ